LHALKPKDINIWRITHQIVFFSIARISSSSTSYHFGSARSVATFFGISKLDNWEVKAEKFEDKFEYDIKLNIWCLVHDLTGFVMAIGSYVSGYKIWFFENRNRLTFLSLRIKELTHNEKFILKLFVMLTNDKVDQELK